MYIWYMYIYAWYMYVKLDMDVDPCISDVLFRFPYRLLVHLFVLVVSGAFYRRYAVTWVLYARIEPKRLIIKDNNECVLSVGGLAATGSLRGQVYPDTVVLAARHGLVQVWLPWSGGDMASHKLCLTVLVFSTLSGDDFKSHKLLLYP